jgi:hypothetical protein
LVVLAARTAGAARTARSVRAAVIAALLLLIAVLGARLILEVLRLCLFIRPRLALFADLRLVALVATGADLTLLVGLLPCRSRASSAGVTAWPASFCSSARSLVASLVSLVTSRASWRSSAFFADTEPSDW